MRIAIVIFYWLCAVGLLILGIESELDEERNAYPKKPLQREAWRH